LQPSNSSHLNAGCSFSLRERKSEMREMARLLVAALCLSYAMKNEALTLQTSPKASCPSYQSKLFHPHPTKQTTSLYNSPASSETPSSVSYYSAPSIFTPTDSRPIVLFDGNCNLCSWAVQLILDNDRAIIDERGELRVAALQSRVGLLLLDRMPPSVREKVLSSSSSSDDEEGGEEKYKSIVVCDQNKTFLNSNAVLRIGRALKFPFRPLALLAYIVPSFVRDFIYGIVSKNRKKWFGTRADCRLWDDSWDLRFVDDDILGGEGSGNSDPFADPNAPKSASVKEELKVEVGDRVRVISEQPIVLRGVRSHPDGLCVSGCIGTVTKKPDDDGDGDSMISVDFKEHELFGEDTTVTSETFSTSIAKDNLIQV